MDCRKILKIITVLFILGLFYPAETIAQGKKKSNGPPPWAPAHGYRAKTKQIYFPEHNFYFDVEKGVYIYLKGANWEVNAKLPPIFGGIDLKIAKQVELNINSNEPQKFNSSHQEKYVVYNDEKNTKSNPKGKKKGKNKKR